jgi:hypothetical protein
VKEETKSRQLFDLSRTRPGVSRGASPALSSGTTATTTIKSKGPLSPREALGFMMGALPVALNRTTTAQEVRRFKVGVGERSRENHQVKGTVVAERSTRGISGKGHVERSVPARGLCPSSFP